MASSLKISPVPEGELYNHFNYLDADHSKDWDPAELSQMTPPQASLFIVEAVEENAALVPQILPFISLMKDPSAVREEVLLRLKSLAQKEGPLQKLKDSLSDLRLKADEINESNCLRSRTDETCFPKKVTPGLAVDYESRRARVEGLPREEGERQLVFFADQAEELGVDLEEAWVYFETEKRGETSGVWFEVGYLEEQDSVRADLLAVSDAAFQLKATGSILKAMSLYHIHQKDGRTPGNRIYSFNSGDLDFVTALLPPRGDNSHASIDARIATPAGLYVLKPEERNWEDRSGYYERFVNGVRHFMDEEDSIRAQCFRPGVDFVEASRYFALLANVNLAAFASPVAVSFIPLPDR